MAKKLTLALVALMTAAMLSLCLGAARLTPAQLWQALLAGPQNTAGYIFWYLRLPRTCACILAGSALAVSGAVIQTVLHNSLASPSIIGVNAGAGLAVTVCCALGVLSGWTIAGAAFFGALSAVLLILLAAEKAGASRTTLILGGEAVNACLNSLSEALTVLVPEAGMLAGDFRVGGFSAVSWPRLLPAGGLILIALLLVFSMGNLLEVLSLGDETAHGLGLPVRAVRRFLLILSAALAGAAVSFGGLLGFVGLIVPHAVRKLGWSESRYLLPMSAILGGSFVTFCDITARMAFAPYELSVGILLSLLGGPVFLWLLWNRKGGRSHG